MIRHRALLLLSLYLALVIGGWWAGRGLVGAVELDIRPSTEPRAHVMIMTTTAVYILASAIPFVPGAEIGLALMVALGAEIVFLVYVSMVAALLAAYLVGRFVPIRVIAELFRFLGLQRARRLVLEIEPLNTDARLALLVARAPQRVVPFLLRHRYLALAVLFNVPGNTLVGGGGGIALVAGMSGLYRFPVYVATVLLAVAPVPLLVVLTGRVPL